MNLERQSPSGVFLRHQIIFDFFDTGARSHVCNTRTCTQKISYFHVLLEKDQLSLSCLGKNNMFSRKKRPSFQIIQERSYSSTIFLERPSFQDIWKKKIWFSVQCYLLSLRFCWTDSPASQMLITTFLSYFNLNDIFLISLFLLQILHI